MKLLYPIIISGLFLVFLPIYADTLNLDKTSYFFGDEIKISGKVTFIENEFIGLQIINPSKSDIVTIDQFLPNNDGSFSKTYKAQGPKWNQDGVYSIKIVYNNETFQETFQFQKESTKSTETKSTSGTSSSTKQNTVIKSVPPMDISNPKLRVQGFPDPSKSPSFYLERYDGEQDYKDWFDNTFPEFTIMEVVGYKTTHIPNFPNNDYSPLHYIDRYNKENIYQDWFDSQFPATSIYTVLGYSESQFQKVPNWIKNNARWWSSGLISDSDFLSGIEFLISEDIILIPSLPESGNSDVKTVPAWIKNTSKWWADDQIDENEFLKGIQFLVENGIIKL